MNTYGWLLLGQTLLALLVLGLAGGWALWPFRREERPYMWVAAPMAGVITLGGTLAVLYFFAALPFRWCLWLGLAVNVAGTIACLVRGRPGLPSLGRRTVGVAVILVAAYWATFTTNRTAIQHREPTIAVMDGSDMYGYAITADWFRSHPTGECPRTDRVFEVLTHVNLYLDGGRQLSFLLTAAAGEARGTDSLFSYDWAAGVIFAAGMLGFGGVFASNGWVLALLVAGGATSNWLPNARTGFMARSIAYPGTVLVVGLFLLAVARPTWRCAAVLAALGAAVAFSLAPVFITVVLALVTASYLGSLAVTFPLKKFHDRAVSFRAEVARPAAVVVVLFAATVGPSYATYYAGRSGVGVPVAPTDWAVVIPVALDLEPPATPLLTRQTEIKLLYGCAALLAILAAIALRHRQPVALALLGFVAVVPGSWFFQMNLLHTFQGIIYPLTLAGAALLAAPLVASRWGRWGGVAVALLLVGTIALRVPQARATCDRYVFSATPARAVIDQSEARGIRQTVGSDPVDVWMGNWPDNCFVISGLAPHGVDVRLRSPAWERSLMNWAAHVNCPAPDLLGVKSRFTLVEREAYAPPESVRYVGRRYKVCEDGGGITVLGVSNPQAVIYDEKGRTGFWIGNAPTALLINNGTGRPATVRATADTIPGGPDASGGRKFRYRHGTQTGVLLVGPTDWRASIPLELVPGLNVIELVVEDPVVPAPPNQPALLLEFHNCRIEPGGALPPAARR